MRKNRLQAEEIVSGKGNREGDKTRYERAAIAGCSQWAGVARVHGAGRALRLQTVLHV